MTVANDTQTAGLMLRMLEVLSLGPAPAERVVRQLRRSHPLAASRRRVDGFLRLLVEEGLVEEGIAATDGGDDVIVFWATTRGIETLQRRGRYPGAAAVLFTDIVGSTDLIGLHGEQGAHRLRQRHFELLRRQVNRCEGREVKNLGDGLMVVFGGPADALACAIAMQRAVAGDNDRLGLRVGIHAGELLREGSDYFGTTVIVAQRLCDRANAGEILISQPVRDAHERGDPPLQSAGRLELKGIDAPVAASIVSWMTDAADRPDRPGDGAPIVRRRRAALVGASREV